MPRCTRWMVGVQNLDFLILELKKERRRKKAQRLRCETDFYCRARIFAIVPAFQGLP